MSRKWKPRDGAFDFKLEVRRARFSGKPKADPLTSAWADPTQDAKEESEPCRNWPWHVMSLLNQLRSSPSNDSRGENAFLSHTKPLFALPFIMLTSSADRAFEEMKTNVSPHSANHRPQLALNGTADQSARVRVCCRSGFVCPIRRRARGVSFFSHLRAETTRNKYRPCILCVLRENITSPTRRQQINPERIFEFFLGRMPPNDLPKQSW